MRKILSFLLISLFICFSVAAKTLEQKKSELKKIYEVGGISKVEYDKVTESLENSDNKEKIKKKKFFTLKKNTKKTPINFFKKKDNDKDKDKEEITVEKIDELGEIVKLDRSIYPKSMLKKFRGCNNSYKCTGQKAGQILYKSFGGSKSYGQKNPGKMIQAMAMYEVFYGSKLYDTRKAINRFKKNKYKSKGTTKGIKVKGVDLVLSRKQKDEKAIRSLFGINNGRKNMREALGMSLDTPKAEAIKKFWLLGEFLDLGTGVKNAKLDKDLKERQNLLAAYKLQIANLKKKLQNDLEEKEDAKTIE